jgi:methylglutaconyl-CoA hydratase
MQQAYVSLSINNQIGVVEFYTPQHNSLPAAILQQLAQTIKQANDDATCKVIVLQSGGEKTFCAGASFNELIEIVNEEQGLAFFSGFAHVINAIRTSSKFVIGKVQGKAIGGGVGLASACDYTLATNAAQVKLSELAVGIGPFVVGPAVERKIGTTAAYELAIDAANFRDANWAMQKGLYTNVYNFKQDLDEAVLQLANTLTQYSPQAMAAIKKAFWKGTENWDTLLIERAKISGSLVLSQFSKEFIKNFKQKNNL